MTQLAITALDYALNQYLRLSPDTIESLEPLHGKVFAIELTDWQLTFVMIPYANGIHVLPTYEGTADTKIISTLASLVKMSLPGQKTVGINTSLHIQGDIRLGQKLHAILRNIDIDWEEHLSAVTGDVLAHKACTLAGRLKQGVRATAKRMSGHMVTYLQTESQQLVTSDHMQQFIQDCHQIRNDVDRLEAKINHFIFQRQQQEKAET